jgi:hypothetical protein
MCRNSMHENRETLEAPLPVFNRQGTDGEGVCRKPVMYGSRESDGSIVPMKRANKPGLTAAAESVEGRGPTKGNVAPTLLAPDTVPGK